MASLTHRQKHDFARNGFVVLPEIVDDDLIAEARGAVKGDPNTEIDQNQNEPAGAREVFRSINRQLFEYVDDVIGPRLKHPDDPNFGTYSDEQSRVYVRSPGSGRVGDPEARGDRKVGLHIDDQTDGDGALSVLNVGMYLDHVPPRNGGFNVWPGSHWITAAHCELESPDETAAPGTRERAPGMQIRSDSPYESLDQLLSNADLFEIAGDAGSVIFWHPGLVHASGIHLDPGIHRMTAFSRFHVVPDQWEPTDVRHPFSLWDGIDEDLYADIEPVPSFAEN